MLSEVFESRLLFTDARKNNSRTGWHRTSSALLVLLLSFNFALSSFSAVEAAEQAPAPSPDPQGPTTAGSTPVNGSSPAELPAKTAPVTQTSVGPQTAATPPVEPESMEADPRQNLYAPPGAASTRPKNFMPYAAPQQAEADMPPTAPTFAAPEKPRPMFNLGAQQIDVRQQQDPRMMQGAYGAAQPPMYGNAGANGPLYGRGNMLNGAVNEDSQRLLTQVDLQKMAAHDVVLLIDRSSSMAAMDCPNPNKNGSKSGGIGQKMSLLPALLGMPLLGMGSGMGTSRWMWCLHQTADLSQQTQQIFQRGITVVLFSTGYATLPNVTLDRLPQIFNENFPFGGTNLAPPLAAQIGDYFRRREYNGGRVKPLLIGVITDGCPTNRVAVRQAIIQATYLMRYPQEVTIVFFLIGGIDYVGEQFVQDLSINLCAQGARFPIVRAVSFGELQRIGLAKAIADNLQ